MLPIPCASPHFASTSMKRSLTLLEKSQEEPANKRHCATIQPEVIKIHALFARALDTSFVPECSPANESSPSPPSSFCRAENHWGKKSADERKEFLGKAHVNAERFLRQRGVWDGVAQILDRHFTMTASTTTPAATTSGASRPSTPTTTAAFLAEKTKPVTPISCSSCPTTNVDDDSVAAALATSEDVNVDDIIENVVSAMYEKLPRIEEGIVPEPAVSMAPLPSVVTSSSETPPTVTHVVSTTSLDATETAHDLAKALATQQQQQKSIVPPAMEITLVPNPLFSVPNPLDGLDDEPVGTAVTPATDALRVQVPLTVVSHQESDCFTPVSPLSNGEARMHSPTSVPVWCLDAVAFTPGDSAKHNNKAAAREDWEFDPLTLLA